jgi:hypothetical protein
MMAAQQHGPTIWIICRLSSEYILTRHFCFSITTGSGNLHQCAS